MVEVRDHQHVMAFKHILNVEFQFGLTIKRRSPVLSKRFLSLDFSFSDKWDSFLRPKHNVIAIMAHDHVEVVAVPALFPR